MPNIILITIDSLRSDHLGCYGYHRNTSPTIDSLASMGVLFSEAISNGGRTPDAFPSILALGQPPMDNLWVISQPGKTLAQQLKEAGYQTAAFHSSPYLTRYYGYDQGFDTFSDSLDEYSFWKGRLLMRLVTKPRRGHKSNALTKSLFKLIAKILIPLSFRVVRRPAITAENITNQGQSWIKEHKESFFLWLHYVDAHHPYLPLPQYISQFRDQPISRRMMADLYRKMISNPEKLSRTDTTALVDLYDAGIRYVDDNISRLLDSLGDRLEDTIVIVTADHGDEFGEHGNFSHRSLYDGIIRIPLIMSGPGISSGYIVAQQVSLLDLSPTINDLVGSDSTKLYKGKSLLSAINGEPGNAEGTVSVYNRLDLGRRLVSFRTPRWKYIRTERMKGSSTVLSEEIYDLKNDPGENRNIHALGDKEIGAFKKQALAKITGYLYNTGTDYKKDRIRAEFKQIAKL